MRSLDLGQIPCLIEALARLEQVRGQIGSAEVDAKTLDQAAALDDSPAGFPERTPLTRARLGLSLGRESERALLGINLAHAWSLDGRRPLNIRPGTDLIAAFYGRTS
jgi:hypothetical protein